jgi:hypothetical protein
MSVGRNHEECGAGGQANCADLVEEFAALALGMCSLVVLVATTLRVNYVWLQLVGFS